MSILVTFLGIFINTIYNKYKYIQYILYTKIFVKQYVRDVFEQKVFCKFLKITMKGSFLIKFQASSSQLS